MQLDTKLQKRFMIMWVAEQQYKKAVMYVCITILKNDPKIMQNV